MCLHGLSHTFATRALEAGVPIKVVSNILGHAGVQITMDTYSHVLPNVEHEAMEQIADYITNKKRLEG
ncbi:tyrosine-type recombinase/integrase [Eubacteriales bacterium OttesenSCG-928-M02]|nr:tyrosine-type recombinase/integrase [Eubacteriales bacterium OttesenSCG-928-M02]